MIHDTFIIILYFKNCKCFWIFFLSKMPFFSYRRHIILFNRFNFLIAARVFNALFTSTVRRYTKIEFRTSIVDDLF